MKQQDSFVRNRNGDVREYFHRRIDILTKCALISPFYVLQEFLSIR